MSGVAIKIAFRELSGGFRGFWIYLACLAIGTAAIAASGSVTEVFTRGLNAESRNMLGADVIFASSQRRATPDERIFIDHLGTVSEAVSLDVMGSAADTRKQVDVRGVDANYPLLGAASLAGGPQTLQAALRKQGDRWGIAVSRSFLEEFHVGIGDAVRLGPVNAIVTAELESVPDRVGATGTFGPEAIVNLDALVEADRLTPGQLFRSGLRVVLHQNMTLEKAKEQFESEFGAGTMRIRTPEDSVDGLKSLLNTLNSFLAVIGIAALIVGGVGVAQATSSFLDTRIASIAVLKVFGAEAATVRAAYMLQLGALAFIGSLAGVALGAAAPFLLSSFAGGSIPLPQALGVYPIPLYKALVLGMLAATMFALPAIGRARATRPSALFRRISDNERVSVPWAERIGTVSAGILLCVLAIASSYRPGLTALVLGGAALTLVILVGTAMLVKRLARFASAGATGMRRLSLSNLGGAGSLAPTIIPALGLGLALLTLVAAVQANLLRQINQTAPSNAPSVVFSQIPANRIDEFDELLKAQGVDTADDARFRQAPFILARVTALRDEPVVEAEVAESERWVVRGETTITYLANKPPETVLTEGQWWPENYTGPLQVSVEADVAKGLGLGVGDTIEFRVFGRDVAATVTSLRKVEWGTFSIGSNVAFVLSPGTLEAANPAFVAIAKTTPDTESKLVAALGVSMPEVVVFQTRQALETAGRIFTQIAVAVNAAAGIVTLSGLLVLLGTFAALARQRRAEAALLKVFGADRAQVLGLYAGEFALAGAAAALIGASIGVAAAYPIVVYAFEATWNFPWLETLRILIASVLISAIGGAGVGLATLSRTPAQVLRMPGE
jgi:putative ABC transport system permease protein